MYEDAAKQLQVILELVKKCPKALQERCFAILLQGYVDAEQTRLPTPSAPVGAEPSVSALERGGPPADVQRRIGALASRLKVEEEHLVQLFDFTADPFAYHPLEAPGTTNTAENRNLALLV